MRNSFPFLAAALLWTGATLAQQQPAVFAERITTRIGAIEVEHEATDTEYLEALKALFRHLAERGLPPVQAPPLGLNQLKEQRADILQQIATQLALPKPTPRLEEVYDSGLVAFGQVKDKLRQGMPSRYALWRKDDLKARLRAGQKIEGHALDGDGAIFKADLNFQNNLDQPPEVAIAAIDATWAKVVWPVFIGEKTPQEDIKSAFQMLFQTKSQLGAMEAMGVLAIVHSAVGETLENSWFADTEGRWFQEGLATWLVLEIVSDRVGAADARRYYDPVAVLKRMPSATGNNLEKWVVTERQRVQRNAAFNDGNQARATLVIRAIVAAKGKDIIPKLLSELGKQKEHDLPALYAAFKKLTGEDMRSYFAMVTGNEA